jgi:murein DD-endopeptidase MepM/ murein hydrolase activator NlpD
MADDASFGPFPLHLSLAHTVHGRTGDGRATDVRRELGMNRGGTRFNFPRLAVVGVGLALAAIIGAGGILFGSWLHLRALTRDAALLDEQLRHHRVVFDEIREAMASWRELQVKIQESFGPGLAAGGGDRGIGGATKTNPERPGLSPSDELNRLSQAVREQTESLRALEQLMTRAGRALAALPSRWPVRGAVNSEFGYRHSPWLKEREFHAGIDIRAARGTPVYAPTPGTVIQAGHVQDYGTTIIVNHGQDVHTLYGHLSKLNVQSGQRVERGALIGYTGNTGRSSGPHLHYEIAVRGRAVNPRAYLWE